MNTLYKFLILAAFFFCLASANTNTSNETSVVTSSNTLPILVKLTEDNFISIRGPINGRSASKAVVDMMGKKTKNLYVYIMSNGGSVVSGMEIVHALQAIEQSGTEITCLVNVGLSMGFVIMQYCKNRYVMPSSVLMQHQASLGVEGPLNNVNNYMNFISSMTQQIDVHQAARLNLTLDVFQNYVRDDWWLFGADAVRHNVADKLVYILCDFEAKTYTETHQTIFGEVDVTYSTCPLANHPTKIEFKNNVTDSQRQEFTYQYDIEKYIKNKLTSIKTI
jgi:ATP-dependent protease ClpP protease subunit